MQKSYDAEQAYKDANALLEGHFLLASGNHSNRYLQSAKVHEYPKKASLLTDTKEECSLPNNVPLFALDDFTFEMFTPDECPMCKEGSAAIKPGSKG